MVYMLNQRVNKTAIALLTGLFGLLLLCGACNKNMYVWVYYDETYCSNAWETSNNNESLKQNVIELYKGKGISIYDIEIFNDRDPEQNLNCFNKTGRRLKCKIKNKDLSKSKSEGFYQ